VIVECALTNLETLTEALKIAFGPGAVRTKQPLARYTVLRVGGPADLLVRAESSEVLRQVVTAAWQHGVPCRVLGGGSNVLVSDAGWRGLIVLNRARAVRFPIVSEQESRGSMSVHAESGASLSSIARQCVSRGLAGLEWATGIPGTVGGAIVGNAGAWGGDIASALMHTTILEPDGSVTTWPVERLQYSYRSSILKQQATDRNGPQQTPVVLDAHFRVREEQRERLEASVVSMAARRRASQPPGATCGSVFRNPPGDYAGRLIEAAGLKGARHGGAQISPHHANFIVNDGCASAEDIMALVNRAQGLVRAEFGIDLEPEIEFLGDW
jgi:UDP-N-acetylmuramate dehydrogenase